MKTIFKFMFVALMFVSMTGYGQMTRLFQFERPVGKAGLNVFEAPKADTIEYDGQRVRVGGDFSIIFQGLSQSNDLVGDTLVELSNNFTLPTANLNLDVQIADGLRMHLRTYLSSKNHPDAWVKGGYFQIDKLDFIKPGLWSGLMEVTRLRFGMDEINYGDTHFRRSDNARAMYNPFVGNYIMDAFTTEPFGEVSVFPGNFIGVLGVSNGRLNQAPLDGDNGMVVYGKLGYDKQINNDLRVRLTGSFYNSSDESTRDYLYNGDRAGSRYYNIFESINDGGTNFLPRFNTGFPNQTAIMINPFVKFQGFEFFGVFETVSNGDDAGGEFTQLGTEFLYRFGGNEQFYAGLRWNKVEGERADGAPTLEITRTNFGGGWFLTNNVMAKLEYVTSTYDGDGWAGSKFQGAEFDGFVIEAVISF